MQRFTSVIKHTAVFAVTVLLLGFYPLVATRGALASADDATPCTAPLDSTPGVHAPSGADAGTYTYQCEGQYAGLYYNGYYTYNPSTNVRTPLYPPNYAYNCTTERWTMDSWDYSPAQGQFVKSRVRAAVAPDQPTGCPPPVSTPPSSTDSNQSTISGTGTDSQNTIDNSGTVTSANSNTSTLGMNNTINSNASSGNAYVLGNTIGGDASTGDASAIVNVMNLLQSTSGVLGTNTAVFTANINGDVNGDFMFDPNAVLADTGSGSQNGIDNNLQINTNDANTTDAHINNNIDVTATSGDAKVAGNTIGGDATSGNATAIVNLMNLINSTVAAGHSFVGTININGNLNGDILLPQDFIDQLLAASGANSQNAVTSTVNGNSTITNSTTSNMDNNVTSTATSGDAKVSGNTLGGSAASGSAKTNVTLLNLTGSNVIGKNDLLVFVNVLGHWVGMIMNAPAGSTTAALGGGITNSGTNSTNSVNNSLTDHATTTNTGNFGINNDVNVTATSGDATVKNNTIGGSATTGNANTAVNVLNLVGSNLDLSNWFGILFINVFGLWNGSFGVNTSAGDPINNPTNNPVQAANHVAMASQFKQFVSFVRHSSTTTGGSGSVSNPSTDNVLGAAIPVAKKIASASTTATPTPDNASHSSFFLPIVGVCLAGAIILVSERERIFGRK